MLLPALSPDRLRPQVDVQQTTFAHDLMGRWVCDMWLEAIQNGGRPFDAVVIGGGMHGGYCAEKLYRFGEGIGLRILVLEAGPFLAATHLQNLPGIGLSAPGDPAVTVNSQDPGPQNVVWGIPWHSDTGFPGLAYCIGGRSLFWGGWAPKMLDADLGPWPQAVRDYLTIGTPTTGYEDIEDEIGVKKPQNFLETTFGQTLHTALLAAAPAGLTVADQAPLAVQGAPPSGALFSFDKYSTANLLIAAIREDIARTWTLNDNSRRRLMLVPRAHITQLFTDGTGSTRRIALTVDGQPQTLTVGQELAPNCLFVLAAGTIESTRLALSSFPATGMGANLMAHLRSDITLRIKRPSLGLGPQTGTNLETAALFVRGQVPLPGAATRQFHLQITAAPSPTADTEANLFTAIPDLEHLDQIRASQDPDWVVFVFRALGEMAPDRSFTDPFASKDLAKNWINLTSTDPQQRDENGLPRAWVHLAPSPDDGKVSAAMEKAALDLGLALAHNNAADIQYWDGSTFRPGQITSPQVAVNRNRIGTTHHEAGTLWMGDAGSSVTDADGRFHHLANTYVAGPALFPTMGSANPTLTALAVAHRTAQMMVNAVTPSPSPNPRPLFNGTLDGWQMAGAGGFTVIGGNVLQSFGGLGLLWYTREEFGDFELTLDWRVFKQDGNSGVFIRFPALNSSSPPTDWQLAVGRGYEIQIDDSGYNPDTNTSGDPAHETGSIYAIQAPSKLASNPIGQWNTYRIRAQADKLNVWLNGTQVITDFVVDNIRPRKGHIGLQNHSGITGPSLAEFKNVQIMDL
jgi:choline dehydrogenase-like flavoprotein